MQFELLQNMRKYGRADFTSNLVSVDGISMIYAYIHCTKKSTSEFIIHNCTNLNLRLPIILSEVIGALALVSDDTKA